MIDAERRDADLDEIIDDDDDVAMAAVTLAELLVGVALASPAHRPKRSAFVRDMREAIPTLPYNDRVAEAHAQLLATVRAAGRPRGAHDLIIAATAVSSGRTVVTSDPAGFHDLPSVAVRTHR